VKKLLAVMAVAVLGSGLAAARFEEETLPVKVYVKGMSCPTGCGTKVAAGLKGLDGAKDVKLTDFEAGLFTVAFDPKASVKPSVIQKALGSFEVTKVEATLTGTVARVEKALVLTTPSGAKYDLVNGDAKGCAVETAKKVEEPKKADAAKKGDDCECCDAKKKDVVAKIDALLKENKTSIKVTGVVSECCQGSLTVALSAAEGLESKKATN